VNLSANSAASARLREIGFCESAEVCKVADHGACICMLMGARVAIGRELAASVIVERMK
jgi:Fe2+ transport system protein FeoA